MNFIQAIILAVVQGISEWLPISSSGHLAIANHLFGLEQQVLFDTMLHLATFIAAAVVLWPEIKQILTAVFTWNTKAEGFQHGLYIIVATIPIIIVGLLLKDLVEASFSSLLVVGISLIITGTLLWSTKYVHGEKKLDYRIALLIGLAQVIALLPGMSRSGITISVGLLLGLRADRSARFSFLLFMPAIAGATVLQSFTADWSQLSVIPSLVGIVLTIIIGVIALKWLLQVVSKGVLYKFSWYCWLLGALLLVSRGMGF